MTSIRFVQTVAAVLVTLLVTCCAKEKATFESRFTEANNAYFGQDSNHAKTALTEFIARAEADESVDRKAKNIDYDRVLAMAWLQLASIHDIEGNRAESDSALGKAIHYFDRVEQIAADPKYQKDKRKTLQQFLIQTESYQKPEWKKRLSGQQGTWSQ